MADPMPSWHEEVGMACDRRYPEQGYMSETPAVIFVWIAGSDYHVGFMSAPQPELDLTERGHSDGEA